MKHMNKDYLSVIIFFIGLFLLFISPFYFIHKYNEYHLTKKLRELEYHYSKVFRVIKNKHPDILTKEEEVFGGSTITLKMSIPYRILIEDLNEKTTKQNK